MKRLVLASWWIVAACTDPPAQGSSTHASCPTTAPLTYASFGASFFGSYCLECHSQQKTGADRRNAPVTIDFDTRSLVRENTSDIDKQAAFGPDAKNHLMPPDGHPKPTDTERTDLGRYIACEIGN